MKKLSALVSQETKIKVDSIKPHATRQNLYVLTSGDRKYAVGAKTLPTIDVDDYNYLVPGTFRTFESDGVTWISTGASSEKLVL